jgi:N-acetyltransferase
VVRSLTIPYAAGALAGTTVRLEPLGPQHAAGIAAVGLDPELWRITMTRLESPADVDAYVATAVREREAGVSVPFATVLQADGRVVGSTRFGSFAPEHHRAEIGWTWIASPWQRSAVNTEAKYLMLRHAFEVWKLVRVEFKTDVLNMASRNAILRLGAKEEGIFRKHQLAPGPRWRDSIYFAITDDDWPAVKAGLESRMARR